MASSLRLLSLATALVAGALLAAACGSESTHFVELADGGDRADTGTSSTGSTSTSPASSDAGAKDAAVDAAPVEEEEGEATYYDANGTGACGFPASTDYYVVAMNGVEYDKDNCGSCIEVTGPKGTVTVRIVDKCPGCGQGDLDLSITAFTKIADKSAGRVPVSWHYTECP